MSASMPEARYIEATPQGDPGRGIPKTAAATKECSAAHERDAGASVGSVMPTGTRPEALKPGTRTRTVDAFMRRATDGTHAQRAAAEDTCLST